VNCGFGRRRYVGFSSRIVDATGAKEMYSVSVSNRKVLLSLDIENMLYSV
jgi:hypothetical protein